MTKDTLERFSNKINSKFLFDYDLKKSNWFKNVPCNTGFDGTNLTIKMLN